MNEVTPKRSLELIAFLVSKERRLGDFAHGFKFIHHMENHPLDKHVEYLEGIDNFNDSNNARICRRMELMKELVETYLANNPHVEGVTDMRFQSFAKRAVERYS